ncbi:DNA gyrase subunit A, partial [bacterium]|nr:DNA gyrase subunit A [bacterium]
RNTRGVRGINLSLGDFVVTSEILQSDYSIFTITEKGIGKRTDVSEYRTQARAGKGIINIKVTERSGYVVGVKQVSDDDEITLISKEGILIKVLMSELRHIGRNTQGVKVMNVSAKDGIVSIEKSYSEEDLGDEE